MTPRFKIDFYDYAPTPFGLYFAKRTWWATQWTRINSFETREAALAYYAKVKDLPEYLD